VSTAPPRPFAGPVPKDLAAAVRRALRRLEIRQRLEGGLTFAAFAGGLALAGFGVSLVSLPAALIAGGLTLAALAALYERGRG